MWLKLAKIDRFFDYFHVFLVVEHVGESFRTNTVKKRLFKKIEKIHFWSILAFHFWVNMSLSMMSSSNLLVVLKLSLLLIISF
jgi:hypothetical protein